MLTYFPVLLRYGKLPATFGNGWDRNKSMINAVFISNFVEMELKKH